jgi:hypothetical protein
MKGEIILNKRKEKNNPPKGVFIVEDNIGGLLRPLINTSFGGLSLPFNPFKIKID